MYSNKAQTNCFCFTTNPNYKCDIERRVSFQPGYRQFTCVKPSVNLQKCDISRSNEQSRSVSAGGLV